MPEKNCSIVYLYNIPPRITQPLLVASLQQYLHQTTAQHHIANNRFYLSRLIQKSSHKTLQLSTTRVTAANCIHIATQLATSKSIMVCSNTTLQQPLLTFYSMMKVWLATPQHIAVPMAQGGKNLNSVDYCLQRQEILLTFLVSTYTMQASIPFICRCQSFLHQLLLYDWESEVSSLLAVTQIYFVQQLRCLGTASFYSLVVLSHNLIKRKICQSYLVCSKAA